MSESEQKVEKDSGDSSSPYNDDWFLSEIIRWTNDAGFELGLTLHVGGSLVSGITISGEKYFEAFKKQMTASFSAPSETISDLENAFNNFQKIYVHDDETADRPPPHFIHLKEARTYSANGTIPKNSGVLWRGHISSVDGFSLGRLVASDE
jgi:hypothetical protein